MAKITCCIAFFLITLVGCKKSDSATAPEEPTGNISVNIDLFDEFGSTYTPKSGVTITVSGGGQAVSKSTDANGYADFIGLRYATYKVSAQKAGFETFSGDYTLSSTNQNWGIGRFLTQLPTVVIDSLNADVNSGSQIVMVGGKFSSQTPAGKTRAFVLFFGSTNSVSHSLSTHQYSVDFGAFGSTTFSSSNVYTSLKAGGFASGATVHVTARAASHTNGYNDPTSARFVYTAIETLSTIKRNFVLP